MAKALIFDTETTGLSTESSKVLEFAYMLLDHETGNVEHDVMYFNTDEEVPAAASIVNGLTRAKLGSLSSGLYFDERLEEMREVFHKADILVGHNIKSYDIPLMMSNFRMYGQSLSKLPDGKEKVWQTYDTMLHAKDLVPRAQHKAHSGGRSVYYGPKLVTTYAWICKVAYGKTASDMDAIFNTTYSTQGCAHEALYDVWMSFVAYKGLLALNA